MHNVQEYLNYFTSKKFFSSLLGKTIYQKTLRIYLFTAFLGAVLLWIPTLSTSTGINLLDAFFISISAFTNTGLSTVTTSETFTFFGQLVILILIQLGGIGFITAILCVWSLVAKGGSLNAESRWFLHFERGSYNKVESTKSFKAGVIVLIATELIGAFILTIFFFCATPATPAKSLSFQGNFFSSLWAGIFHSVSASNNAGFDILGDSSIMPYRHGFNNILSVVLLIQSVIGGIGYPIYYDLYLLYKKRKNGQHHHLSLFTIICLRTYFFVAFAALFLVLFFEVGLGKNYATGTIIYPNDATKAQDKYGEWGLGDKLWNIVYTSFSARSAGFSSLDVGKTTEETKWLLAILMFVGTSPASTGGGIRTITIFLILAKIYFTIQGKNHLTIKNKTVDPEIIFDACQTFIVATILIIFCIFLIFISLQNRANLKIGDVFFEASSAFGTVGLTANVTKQCNFFGKIVIIFLMFIGQLGVSNSLLSFTDLQPKSKNIRYCGENLRIS